MTCIRKDIIEKAKIDNLPEDFDPMKEKIYAPHFGNEVRRCYGYLYGHYDSYGGAMLILADSLLKAHRIYFNEFMSNDNLTLCEIAELYSVDSILDNDFIGMITIIVIGRDITDLVNKDIMYGDQYRKFTNQFYPVAYKSNFIDVFNSKILVLINRDWYYNKNGKKENEICTEHYKFDDINIVDDYSPVSLELQYWDLGDDAYGLILMVDKDYKWRGEVNANRE
jgi:hypothetical protein